MQDHASSPAGSGTAPPRALGALGDPVRLGAVRVLSGAGFPGVRSAPLSTAVAGHAPETRDEN
ncbi:hypothetical protein [Streptomyces hirsutus]|uniref:hypothetical protein n=1 Tax=Streptomyces hirsutus TaxID=35620 RepID=UPI003646462B